MKVFFLCSVLLLLLTFSFSRGWIRTNYPSRKEFPVQGIDISHHQGEISWSAIDIKRYQFVFMKATEGGDFVDPRFASNWHEAEKNNLKRGAYHFYRLNKTGVEQAKNFIKTVPVDTNDLPHVADLEVFERYPTGKSNAQIQSEIKEFLTMLENHYGKRPLIYTTYEFQEYFLQSGFEEYQIWIRDIWFRPRESQRWTFWQYSSKGHVVGIKGFVDLNVYRGSTVDFEQF